MMDIVETMACLNQICSRCNLNKIASGDKQCSYLASNKHCNCYEKLHKALIEDKIYGKDDPEEIDNLIKELG